jgi:hypothetical protein
MMVLSANEINAQQKDGGKKQKRQGKYRETQILYLSIYLLI